jgi:tRNA(Ser,Leu) C12 N-acetylase TAN1
MNVLVMKVDDARALLDAAHELVRADPSLRKCVARISPATTTFRFGTADEFRVRASDALRTLALRLAGLSFHVRIHRRGRRGMLVTPNEERMLDAVILDALEALGASRRIAFDDPDAIVAVETVDGEAGIAIWTRRDLDQYPLLGLDRGKRATGAEPAMPSVEHRT